MNKNTIIISALSVVGTFILLFFVYNLINKPENTNFPQAKVIKTDDHVKWSPNKKNILVEYSDFQCPACKTVHDILKTIDSSSSADFVISKKVTFVYRHYPLYQIHNKAYVAAYAAEAAGKQNKFFEMADILFNNQTTWEKSNDPQKDNFLGYAKKLGLNVDQFKKDSDSPDVKQRVDRDMNEAQQMGVDSTPTFFLNGQKVEVNSYQDFMTMLKNL